MSHSSKRFRREYEEKDLSIEEIFNEVINKPTLEPRSYPLEFEVDSLKELFEFLLQDKARIVKVTLSENTDTVGVSCIVVSEPVVSVLAEHSFVSACFIF